MQEDSHSPESISFEPYSTFTERTATIQYFILHYRDSINGLICPVSAGWPDLLDGVLKINTSVIGYDVNKRQIEWYRENSFLSREIQCIESDISNPTIEFKEKLDNHNFLFVSNIPDWLQGITGRAMRSSESVHRERITNFINLSSSYLNLADCLPRFILVSSISNNFLQGLASEVVKQIDPTIELFVRIPEVPKNYRDGKSYPINNYLILEAYRKT